MFRCLARPSFLAGLLAAFLPSPGAAEVVAVRAGRLIDGRSSVPISGAVILVDSDRITDVGPSVAIPTNARVIDLSRFTVLPGLIDAHTHLCLTPDYSSFNPVLNKSIPYRAMEGAAGARLTLDAGFTTLRDVDSEGAGFADVALRDAIARGLVPGP